MINIQGGRSRPLGRVTNIPLQINGIEIPINVDITESTDYYIVAGNDWLTKCHRRLYWDCQKFTFCWNNKEYQIPMTCWEKPQFDHFQQPVDIVKSSSDEEYENEELIAQRHYMILEDHNDSMRLAESNPKQTLVDGQKYSSQYFESLNQKFNVQPPKDAKWKYHWQGPGNRCWCHNKLDKIEDNCQLCKKEWDHWQLLRNIPDEPPSCEITYNILMDLNSNKLLNFYMIIVVHSLKIYHN